MTNIWKGKKIVVTGASGFIGSHFIEELCKFNSQVFGIYSKSNCTVKYLSKQNNLTLIQLDLTKKHLFDITQIERADLLINCAALDGNSTYKLQYAAEILDTNIRIVSNVLNSARISNIQKVVLVSSAEVYPESSKSPIIETDSFLKNFDHVDNGYVLSKRYTELLGILYNKQYGLKVYLPRPTNVYGPRDKYDPTSNRVIPSMIRRVINGEPIEIWGSGRQKRGFIYIKDLVNAILQMSSSRDNQIMNIGTPEVISITKLAHLICSISGSQSTIRKLKNKPSGRSNRILNVEKLKSLSGHKYTKLIDGLRLTIDWYKSNYQ